MSDVLTPEVVAGVSHHLNDDHADDGLRIVQGLGGQPSATAARMTDLVASGALFEATVDGQPVTVEVPWGRPITERADIRMDIVRMHTEACDGLGIEPASLGGEH